VRCTRSGTSRIWIDLLMPTHCTPTVHVRHA
jgi:hypothetical protein